MREREINTAKHFGILEKMKELERELLKIEGVPEIDFDLDGFWSDIFYMCLIPKYEIPISTPDYYEQRRKRLRKILDVCAKFDLSPSVDRIEDYGEHWYIVMRCGNAWRRGKYESNH